MGIAIKKLEQIDIEEFTDFLKADRTEIPELSLASLVFPHEDMAVVVGKREFKDLKGFAEKYQFVCIW